MREIWLVSRREFLERVTARTFLIGTFLFPLLMAALMYLPATLDGGEERRVVIVDETASGIGQAIAAQLSREREAEGANRYFVELVTGPAQAAQPGLISRVEAGEIDGYLVVPVDVFTSNEIQYRSTAVGSPGMLREIGQAASESVRGERLRLAGIEMAMIADAVRPVSVENVRLGEEGEERGDAETTFVVAYILAFIIYFMVFFYGVNVMRSVLEEKTSRIAEVLVSSLRSTHLMAGKIVGVAGAALLQVALWAALITLFLTQSGQAGSGFSVPPEVLSAISLDPGVVALLLAYFLLGFFLFAALFAALGAAVTTEQEAQSFQMVLILPLLTPLLFLVPLTSEPLGTAATALGLFPLTSPVAMPMRLSAAPIPPVQIALSLALLTIALVAVAWLSGKVYRIGMLATGKRPSVAELVRWVRMA